ncbi:MAG: glycosyltransferase family 2 protein [Anaerolineae bacterium]
MRKQAIWNHKYSDNELNTLGPIRSLSIDLAYPLPAVIAKQAAGIEYDRALILVKIAENIIGTLQLNIPHPSLTNLALSRLIWQELKDEIIAFHTDRFLPAPVNLPLQGFQLEKDHTLSRKTALESAPFASVVIATRNRTTSLRVTIDSLLKLNYPHYNIIVVDNAPSTDETETYIREQFAHNPMIIYLREDRPGLAAAHNKGLSIVDAPIVAFTDDDVVVEPNWLLELANGFTTTDTVAAVTGMIWPAELNTPAQIWTEQFGGFGKGLKQRIFGLTHEHSKGPLFPYTVGDFGSGANMAFKTDPLKQLGGFDTALGAGSKGMGGDDLDAFFQIITQGYDLVYEPNAVVWHWHRAEYAGLKRTAFGYGAGFTAFLTKSLLQKPSRILDVLKKLPAGIQHLANPSSRKNQGKAKGFPKELNWLERKGMLYGPIAYFKSRREQVKLASKS